MSHHKTLESPGFQDDDDKFGSVHVEQPDLATSDGHGNGHGNGHGHIKGAHVRSAEEKAAELRAAQLADPGPKVGSKAHAMFVFYVMVCCMCSGDNGFDGWVFRRSECSWFSSGMFFCLSHADTTFPRALKYHHVLHQQVNCHAYQSFIIAYNKTFTTPSFHPYPYPSGVRPQYDP
jgi:hypothetical protein